MKWITHSLVRPITLGGVALWFLLGLNLPARIEVVTLPARDAVQLTIYNSVDLTLVKETRTLTLRQGLNRLEFSWANTLIDPTSVEFQAITHADAVEVLDVSFPPRVTNTLEWHIHSEYAGEVQVEIRYFTSGIGWSADYVAEANAAEQQMDLAGYVRVNNHSGEDYENAQVRLVVGVVRLVEAIADLAQPRAAGVERALKLNAQPALRKQAEAELGRAVRLAENRSEIEAVKEIAKAELSEYFMYTVEGRDTIPNGWSRRLPSFRAKEVPITSFYKYEKERWGDQAIRFYRFTNNIASHLGKEPLPDGGIKAFRVNGKDDRDAFIGSSNVQYIPINEQVEVNLGQDQEVLIKPMLMHWEKTDIHFDNHGDVKGWTIRETWRLELQNSKGIPVLVDVRRNFKGDWSLATDAEHEKVDAQKIKFVRTLRRHEKQSFTYELTTRYGTNVNR